MDGSCNLWKMDDFSWMNTWANVHKLGILYGEIVGDTLVTAGGDLLVKLHTL